MNIALAHHWIMSYRGGERVAEQMAAVFPGADLYTLAYDTRIDVPGLRDTKIHTSVLNSLPGIARLYKHLLPIHPWAIDRMRVPDDVDILLSSDASLIKGINIGMNTQHVCYCHSPPRYLWEMGDDYKRHSLAARFLLDRFGARLRRFDRKAASDVDHFLANSKFVANRIKRYYRRESTVIYPPVATHEFRHDRKREDFHFVLSELVPYKRIDLAVEAYNQLGIRLVIVGDGSERKRLQKNAGANIEFLGRQPFAKVRELMETCQAFIFPGVEDFGITPVEAQASGAPVIAFRGGGALETVVEHQTGCFFDEQTPQCLADTVTQFQPGQFSSADCRKNTEKFSQAQFRTRLGDFVGKTTGYQVPTPQRSTAKSSNHVLRGPTLVGGAAVSASTVATTSTPAQKA